MTFFEKCFDCSIVPHVEMFCNRLTRKCGKRRADRYQDKNIVLPKLKMFAEICKKKPHSHNSIVYVLVNHSSTIEEDLERIYTLRDMGYWAYVMIYDKTHCNPLYVDLQRWCNNRFIFAKCPRFEDYNKVPQLVDKRQLKLTL